MSKKAVTVEEASPSPPPINPPLPGEPEADFVPPLPEDNPAESTDAQEEWDPAAETDLKDRKAAEEKEASVLPDPGKWQAVWAPAANAYYFWNSETNETTWTNPLAPPPLPTESSSEQPPLPDEQPPLPAGQPPLPVSAQPPLPGSSWGQAYGNQASSSYAPTNAAAGPSVVDPSGLPPIDPDLAHLLPKSSLSNMEGFQTAQFNARTGRFTPSNFQYTVDHLAEANRARRQEGVFFDVNEWDQGREKEWAERKRKEMEGGNTDDRQTKLSKADMDRFRQKKAEKRARNNAWLKG